MTEKHPNENRGNSHGASVPEFAYDVFISYSHRDKGLAKSLHHQLQSYLPPRGLSPPRRRLRIFRDEDESRGGKLGTELNAALMASERLLVICSPAARSSHWVNQEIATFAIHRDADKIVTILAEGESNPEAQRKGQPEMAAFPPSLSDALKEEPWPADFRQVGKKITEVYPGWYHLLAAIYGVTREKIEQRERIRARRRLAVVLLSVLAVGLGAATLWQSWEQRKTAQRDRDRERLRKESLVLVAQFARYPPERSANRIKRAQLAMQAVSKARTPQAIDALSSALDTVMEHDAKLCQPKGGYGKTSVAFAPNGSKLALGTPQGSVEIVDLSTRQVTRVLGHVEPITLLKFDDQGRWLISYSEEDRQVQIWDTKTGVCQGLEHYDSVGTSFEACLSPAGDAMVLRSFDSAWELRTLPRGALRASLPDARFNDGCQFSPDGKVFVSYPTNSVRGDNGSFQLYETSSGKKLWQAPKFNEKVEFDDVGFDYLAFSKDGNRVIAHLEVGLSQLIESKSAESDFVKLDLAPDARACSQYICRPVR